MLNYNRRHIEELKKLRNSNKSDAPKCKKNIDMLLDIAVLALIILALVLFDKLVLKLILKIHWI